jgi:hypothetical protein
MSSPKIPKRRVAPRASLAVAAISCAGTLPIHSPSFLQPQGLLHPFLHLCQAASRICIVPDACGGGQGGGGGAAAGWLPTAAGPTQLRGTGPFASVLAMPAPILACVPVPIPRLRLLLPRGASRGGCAALRPVAQTLAALGAGAGGAGSVRCLAPIRVGGACRYSETHKLSRHPCLILCFLWYRCSAGATRRAQPALQPAQPVLAGPPATLDPAAYMCSFASCASTSFRLSVGDPPCSMATVWQARSVCGWVEVMSVSLCVCLLECPQPKQHRAPCPRGGASLCSFHPAHTWGCRRIPSEAAQTLPRAPCAQLSGRLLCWPAKAGRRQRRRCLQHPSCCWQLQCRWLHHASCSVSPRPQSCQHAAMAAAQGGWRRRGQLQALSTRRRLGVQSPGHLPV